MLLKLNVLVRGELVGDGALVAGHDGRGVADLVGEQGQGVVDAGVRVGSSSTVIAPGVKVMVPARPRMMLSRVMARYSSSSRR